MHYISTFSNNIKGFDEIVAMHILSKYQKILKYFCYFSILVQYFFSGYQEETKRLRTSNLYIMSGKRQDLSNIIIFWSRLSSSNTLLPNIRFCWLKVTFKEQEDLVHSCVIFYQDTIFYYFVTQIVFAILSHNIFSYC